MNISEYENYHETKSHGDSMFPYNIYLCSIPLNFTEVPIHWHSEMEIIYIKKGRGIINLDFEIYHVEAGDIVVVIPGQMHGIYQLEQYSMEYENIIFSTDLFLSKHTDRLNSEFFLPLLSGAVSFPHIITEKEEYYADAASCLDRADRICCTFPKGYELALKGYLFEFFYVIFSHSEEIHDTKKKKNLEKIKEVIKYIETNYQSRITIDEISGICGFSSSHFMKFFKNVMGISFIDYLNDYRLSMASRILIASDDKIIKIASDCGYDNLSYFNRVFKKKYGMTPGEYRKK